MILPFLIEHYTLALYRSACFSMSSHSRVTSFIRNRELRFLGNQGTSWNLRIELKERRRACCPPRERKKRSEVQPRLQWIRMPFLGSRGRISADPSPSDCDPTNRSDFPRSHIFRNCGRAYSTRTYPNHVAVPDDLDVSLFGLAKPRATLA